MRHALLLVTLPYTVASILAGVAWCLFTGRTPAHSYNSLVRLYCISNGRSNELLTSLVRLFHPPRPFPNRRGVLGAFGEEQSRGIVANVHERGWHVLEPRLPSDLVDRLVHFARTTPCVPRADGDPAPVLFDAAQPLAHTYHFTPATLLANPDIQRLIGDPGLLSLAQDYLDCEPVLDLVAMWWSAPRGDTSAVSGQLYHFDMDRIKFVRFFFMLTDVTAETGPHCMVSGSHRPGRKPLELRLRGYARIPEADIARHFPPDAQVEFTGTRGTILMNDGNAYHRGKPLLCGERLMLELNYAVALLGSKIEKMPVGPAHEPSFAEAGKRLPRLFAKLDQRA